MAGAGRPGRPLQRPRPPRARAALGREGGPVAGPAVGRPARVTTVRTYRGRAVSGGRSGAVTSPRLPPAYGPAALRPLGADTTAGRAAPGPGTVPAVATGVPRPARIARPTRQEIPNHW